MIDIEAENPGDSAKPIKVKVTYTIENSQMTFTSKEFTFIGLSDDDLKLYPHLAKNVADKPEDIIPEEPVEPEENEPETETPEQGTDKPVEDGGKPDTDGIETNPPYLVMVICAVSLLLILLFIPRRKRT